MWLMTNNPAKFVGLKGYGLAVVGRVPVLTPITEENKRYLETKRTKMGHIYGSDLQGSLPGFNDSIVNNGDSPVNTQSTQNIRQKRRKSKKETPNRNQELGFSSMDKTQNKIQFNCISYTTGDENIDGSIQTMALSKISVL